MKIVKFVPFYMFLAYNIIGAVAFVLAYPDMMKYDMHWGYEGAA